MISGKKPLAFRLHSLLGLKLSLLVLFVCLTGTIAVVSDEIEWLISPKFRASATDRRVSWQAQYDAAQAAFPMYRITYISAGEEPYLASRISATGPSGESRTIYVDPATGNVNGQSGFITFRSFMRALHYYLFAPGDWGFYLVTSLGFVLMGSVITGFLVYKKFWRSFFSLPRTDRSARLFWGTLHKLVALWSAWFVVIIGLTSVWYFGERILYRLDIPIEGDLQGAVPVELANTEPARRRSLDELVARAQAALPGLMAKSIELPLHVEDPIYIKGQASARFVRDRTNGVALNPYTGAVLSMRRAEEMPFLERWVHTADPLHFGDFGGLWSKVLWLVFGLVMCALAASGVLVYAKRIQRQLRQTQPGVLVATSVSPE
jgi:uncharacterized iron-regulated membrane protein